MIFTPEEVEAILLNRKTQTRRLVKEGEDYFTTFIYGKADNPAHKTIEGSKIVVVCNNNKVKWQVGKDYAVQVGKKGLWTDGKNIMPFINNNERLTNSFKKLGWKPLRIKIKSIRKEKLLDISEADAKKEGYEIKEDFLIEFYKLNIKKGRQFFKQNEGNIGRPKNWNPFVWVLEFSIMGGNK